jgi:serine/threonine protein kinase
MHAGGCLDAGKALLLSLDILRGLVDLHDKGIIMADLKPDNILMDDAGKPVLADFGISRAFLGTVGMYVQTSAEGTFNYA